MLEIEWLRALISYFNNLGPFMFLCFVNLYPLFSGKSSSMYSFYLVFFHYECSLDFVHPAVDHIFHFISRIFFCMSAMTTFFLTLFLHIFVVSFIYSFLTSLTSLTISFYIVSFIRLPPLSHPWYDFTGGVLDLSTFQNMTEHLFLVGRELSRHTSLHLIHMC